MIVFNNINNFFPNNIIAGYTSKNNFSDNSNYLLNLNSSEKNKVIKNRIYLENKLKNNIKWLNQVHKNSIVDLDKKNKDYIADASYCTKNKKASVVIVADCLPILVSTSNGFLVGSIHAGWKGLCSQIIYIFFKYFNNKILTIISEKRKKKSLESFFPIHIWFGPCISKKNFVVGKEVKNKFINLNENFSTFFEKIYDDKWLLDLQGIAIEMVNIYFSYYLKNKFIYLIDRRCTFDNPSIFFSHRKNKDEERMAMLIWKNS